MARDFIQTSEQYLSQIDAEIQRLQNLRSQVAGAIQGDREIVGTKRRGGMSEEGRRRVAEAQKARWARQRKAAKKAAKQPAPKPAKNSVAKKTASKRASGTKAVKTNNTTAD